VVLVTPRPLGAYLAARQSPRVPPPAAVGAYPPLPAAVDGAHALTLMEFTSRARYGPEHQMIGKVVRLTGFVTPAPAGEDGFRLTRFVLSCCAGDGTAYQVRVRTPGGVPPPPADTWLVVEGTWRPARSGDQPEVPTLVAATLRQVPQPADPYER
jgi:uncharacterized repeat protein (TIGR03943 family)